MRYDALRGAEDQLSKSDSDQSARSLQPFVEDQFNQILARRDTWLAFLIISSVALAIVLLLVIFLRNRIRIAVALIKEASK
jgi:choline transporter-like protein 2/4/5